jgi:hypothetical protein
MMIATTSFKLQENLCSAVGVVTKEEALALCDIDNAYCKAWTEEMKIRNFFTTMAEHIQKDDYSDDSWR